MLVELADEAAVTHVDQRALDGGHAAASRHGEAARQRRAPAACGHGLGLVDGDEEQLVLVRHDEVAVQQVAQLARLDGTGAHLGHGRGREAFGQEGQQVLARAGGGVLCRAARDIGQAARAGHQAHADFHQADVAFHVRHAARAVDGQLAAAAQRHAMDGRNHGHLGVADAQHQVLQLLLHAFDGVGAADHEGRHGGFQVGAHAERRIARPDDHALEVGLGHVHGFHQRFHDFGADGVHLVLDAGDQDLAVQRPGAQRLGFGDRGAGRLPVGQAVFAQQLLGEDLALVDGQHAAGHELALGRAPRALRRVHAASLGHRAFEDPLGQGRLAQCLAGIDVLLDHLRHFQPAGFLPQLEGALLHAEAPAHGLVHVACGLRNALQVDGRVVEAVAQDGPQEAALRALGIAQQLQALGSGLLEHAAIDLVGLAASGHVVLAVQLELQDVAADLLVEALLRLLAEVAQLDQLGQHGRRAEAAVEGIGLGAEVVLQRLDHMGHGVQAHHVGRAEGAAGCAAQLLAGEVIDHVEGQSEVLDLFHRGQHAGDADAVGDEVGRVLGAHHALAQAAGDEGFELVQHHGLRGRRGDQLHQRHVARRVEEVDAAKARLDRVGQRLGQLGDGQARGVGRHDGVLGHMGRDLGVQIELPVHALGNGLDDQVAALEQLEVLLVVGGLDQVRVLGHADGRRLELLEVGDGALGDAAFRAFLGRQVEQHHGHLDIDQMGRDLRSHHASAEHGDFLHIESGHGCSTSGRKAAAAAALRNGYCTRTQVWVRPKGPMEPRTSSLAPPSMGVRRSV